MYLYWSRKFLEFIVTYVIVIASVSKQSSNYKLDCHCCAFTMTIVILYVTEFIR